MLRGQPSDRSRRAVPLLKTLREAPALRYVGLCFLGVLAALGQAPWNVSYLALAAYAGALFLIARATRPVLSAWLFATVHFGVALHWIMEPFFVDAVQTGWMAPFALVFMAGGLALFWALAAFVSAKVATGNVFALALLFALAEFTRGTMFTGFPWAQPGHIWIDTLLLASASLVGPFGLTLLTLLSAACFAHPLKRLSLVAGGALCAAMLFGALYGADELDERPTHPIVRLIQPNAPQHEKWLPEMVPVFFDRALAQTETEGDPALIVWPETSLPELLERSDTSRRLISEAARQVPVLVGAQSYDGAPRNVAVLLDGEGEIASAYTKHHLVPFGEYLPLERLFGALGLKALATDLAGNFVPGDGPAVIDIPGIGPAFIMICYEAIFPHYLHQVTRPRVLIHMTNDAWFGNSAGPQQHLALARLRAVESGLPVIRAANTGISAVIGPSGEVLNALPLNTASHLDAPLPEALPATLYSKTGDWPWLLLTTLLLIGLIFRRRSIAN